MDKDKKVDESWKDRAREEKTDGGKQQQEPQEGGGEEELAAPDFTVFIAGLGSQGLISLGIVPHPLTGKTEQHLNEARHAIDILSMLEEKTKGNLTDEEAKVLRETLYGLRMRFVELAGEGEGTTKEGEQPEG